VEGWSPKVHALRAGALELRIRQKHQMSAATTAMPISIVVDIHRLESAGLDAVGTPHDFRCGVGPTFLKVWFRHWNDSGARSVVPRVPECHLSSGRVCPRALWSTLT